jgi:serine/threonine-protein kinase
MAEVYLAVMRSPGGIDKLVVLKSIRQELASDAEIRRMFLTEARLSARLNHPNVLQVSEVVDDIERPTLIMEYLEGQPLSVVLDQLRKEAGPANLLGVLVEVLTGLEHAHELKDVKGKPLKLVHRDVSPQNVFITYDGGVKVLDFGIAKVNTAPSQTRTGIIKGKLAYMPPEQLLGGDVDGRTDVFAVGCLLWDIVVGQRLWSGEQEADVMLALMEGVIPKPSQFREVEPNLEAIVMKALAPDPERRFPTAAAFREALEAFMKWKGYRPKLREFGSRIAELFHEQRQQRAEAVRRAISDAETVLLVDRGQALAPQLSDAATVIRSTPPGSPRRWPALVVVVVLSLAAVAVIAPWRRIGAAVPQTGVVSASATPPSAPQSLIALRVRATPAEVSLELDGVPTPGNPARFVLPKDGSEHVVRAKLPGHPSEERRFRAREDVDMSFTFETATVAPSASAAASSVTPAPGPGRGGRTPVANRPGCNPAFYFEDGIKVFKEGCI